MSGPHHPSISPYGLFHTATSPVQVACGSESLWRAFAAAIGLDVEDPRYLTNGDRVAHRDDLTADIEKAFATQPAEHWLALLADAGVPSGKVRTIDDVYAWDQTRSQGLLLEVDHPTQGHLELPGSPIRFDDNPYSGGREKHVAPPTLGQHNDSVRAWLADQD
jgi:crotonobetainyl-CoA:carnitine CoA-transferase CaiB-like acyl-CoA transferase